MGIDYYVYAGPIAVTKTSNAQIEVKYKTCLSCSKGKKLVSAFCPSCGKAGEETSKMEETLSVDEWEVMELFDDALHPSNDENIKDSLIWKPNHSRGEKREFEVDVKCDTIYQDSIDQAEETAWFTEAFSKEIAILKEQYGENNVEIKWALFNTISC